MKITQVRSATVIVEYAGKRFLVDPMLSPKGAQPGFPGTVDEHLRNPLVDLPIPLDQVLDVDAVLVTHTHRDHWDDAAIESIPKSMPLYAQNESDAQKIRDSGFTDVRLLSDTSSFEGVALRKTPGQHGSDYAMQQIGQRLGEVCGIAFEHPSEKTLYLAGDTVWNRHVQAAIDRHRPGVVVVNCGDAQIIGVGSIIMNKEDVLSVCRAAPDAVVVATHMEAVNHALLTRRELASYLAEQRPANRVEIPADGETVVI